MHEIIPAGWERAGGSENPASGEAGAPRDPAAGLQIDVLKDLTTALSREVEALKERSGADAPRYISLHEEVRRFEINLITRALARTGGHQTRAAELLGVKITTLNAKIKRYGIDPEQFSPASVERAA